MAKITIGGEDYMIPELNFLALERAWPFIDAAMLQGGNDPMAGPLAAMRIIAAGIMEDEKFQPERFDVTASPDLPDDIHDQVVNFMRKKLKAREISKLTECINVILVEAGLAPAPGEAEDPPAEETKQTDLPETATASSSSSLPQDVKTAAGQASKKNGDSAAITK